MWKFILLGLLLPLGSFSQTGFIPVKRSQSQLAKVIIYREKGDDWKNKGVPVSLNDEPLTTMWNASWFSYEGLPGFGSFSVGTDPPVVAGIRMEAGVICYLRISIVKDADGTQPQLEFTSAELAGRYFAEYKLRKLGSYNPILDSVKQLKIRINWIGTDVFSIGLGVGQGIGFYSIPMVLLQNGQKARLSSGGGVSFGLTSAYRFTKNIEIQAEAVVQSSSLLPAVSNATASFNRYMLGIALRYSVPFAKRFRFNIGPGVASFQGGRLKTDLSKLQNGYRAEFNYQSSTGYYGASEIEYYFNSISMGMGIKYSANTYTLKSAYIDGYQIPVNHTGLDDFREMKGDGLFINLSIKFIL